MITCGICNGGCATNEGFECIICKSHFHSKCLSNNAPSLKRVSDMSAVKDGKRFIYGCNICKNRPSAQSRPAISEKEKENLSGITREQIVSQLSDRKNEMDKLLARNMSFEEITNDRIRKLEIENNIIRKQLNRGNILVSGLPQSVEDLYRIACVIANSCKVTICENDVNYCSWIRRKRCLLIKFNNIQKRDAIMKNYRKSYSLKLGQILNNNSETRVYLSDHYTPAVDKLRYVCRKKQKSGEIKIFYIQNRDVPSAVVVTHDLKETELTLDDIDLQNYFKIN